jgi:putative peptide modification system cyclase
MMFNRPIQAVAFALDYQRGLRQLNAAEGADLSARVGIHVGDVVVWDNTADDIARGAKPVEVEGLVKPITSRLMSLALPGQILLSNIAYDLAHRAEGELGDLLTTARWRTHGRYRFRGAHEPVAVFEVGEEGLAPLKAPPWSSKAHREVPFWRRPATVVMEVLLLVALIAIPAVLFLKPDPAIAFAKRDWVVVGSLHNLTGETVFDDALESALRIGLEQSRYVNVMPDLKVRDTITRMQRDPDKTEVDREIGSEIAIRDGARALILPTIAEIGGRVRITAEVIDPQTQTTVYSETADGIGKESILPSLDTINSRLRVRLGEALATVSNESLPLEKVATKNLDALRIFSQSVKMQISGDETQAGQLLRNAIEIDPGFALARIELATVILPHGERDEARRQLVEALKSSERLSPKDRLMAEALLAEFSSPQEVVSRWQALATAYPDLFRAQGAYGFYAWHYSNDFRGAIEAIERNVAKQNPTPGLGNYLLGTLLLGTENYDGALKQFEKASSSGTKLQNILVASTYAAKREFSKIDQVLADGRTDRSPGGKAEMEIAKIAYALDAGSWKELDAYLSQENPTIAGLDPFNRILLDDTRLALRTLFLSASELKIHAVDLDDNAESEARADKNFDQKALDRHILFRAWLAASTDQQGLANRLLAQVSAERRSAAFPAQRKLYMMAEAEIAAANGKLAEAATLLKSGIDGHELFASHSALMDIYVRQRDFHAAREEARWLSTHRGRAYAEVSGGPMFVPLNIAQTNISLLVDAECSAELGEFDEAKRSFERFRNVWTLEGMPPQLRRRSIKLATLIQSQTSGR